MKHRIAVLTAIAMAGIPATAQATTPPSATVTITTDKEACKATVKVEWKGKHTHPGGTQVNIDNLGRQDDAKQFSDPGGHTLVRVPSSHTYVFTLAKNAAHVIDAWTVAGSVKVREIAYLDCSTPVPPRWSRCLAPSGLLRFPVRSVSCPARRLRCRSWSPVTSSTTGRRSSTARATRRGRCVCALARTRRSSRAS